MLIFTPERHPSHIVFEGRRIPVHKSKGVNDDGKAVVGGVANVPFEVHQFLVGHPHWQNFEGQVDLPAELNDYAEGKVGDPVLDDFDLTETGEAEAEKSYGKSAFQELKARAKELGIEGYGKMKADELAAAIEEATKNAGNS